MEVTSSREIFPIVKEKIVFVKTIRKTLLKTFTMGQRDWAQLQIQQRQLEMCSPGAE